MSREVRRVPVDWQHPIEWVQRYRDGRLQWVVAFKPLFDNYAEHLADFRAGNWGDDLGPNPAEYMPEFDSAETLGYCMYETTSEGTPISPVFRTPEELAHWLADTGASAFGDSTATYTEWLAVAQGGWAPSAVSVNGGPLQSGVEAMGKKVDP